MSLGKLLKILKYKLLSKKKEKKSDFIFYKIVDSSPEKDLYKIQCVNSSVIFSANIIDIVADIDILYSLHPIQACFIGIEYSLFLKKNPNASLNIKQKANQYKIGRYGTFEVIYERRGQIGFINQITKEDFLMDPFDIALSKRLIQEFDAQYAFYIGFLAGSKIDNIKNNLYDNQKFYKYKHLHIVK